MIKLKLLEVNKELIKEAEDFFDKDYLKDLKETKFHSYEDSIVSRYMVSKLASEELGIANYVPALDFEEEQFENFTYAISHKDWNIFVWISDDFLWLDIEKYKERDESVFEYFTDRELDILGWKNFTSFYTWWTAKESLIKFFSNYQLTICMMLRFLEL